MRAARGAAACVAAVLLRSSVLSAVKPAHLRVAPRLDVFTHGRGLGDGRPSWRRSSAIDLAAMANLCDLD